MADNTQAVAAEAPAEEAPKGALLIRTVKGQRFILDEKTTLTSDAYQEFSATAAKKVVDAAKANGVDLVVKPAGK